MVQSLKRLNAVPGCYFFVGAGNAERGLASPHHSPTFDFDERALDIGAQTLARTALDWMLSGRIIRPLRQLEREASAEGLNYLYNTIERGHFVPSTLLALKLAKALNAKVEELFSLEPPQA